MSYIIALDLSLVSTGVAIFNEDGKCIKLDTIETSAKDETQIRLKVIGDKIIKIKKEYKPILVLVEQGFSRYNIATQMLFRVHGLINYLFADTEQKYYHSTTIRKIIMGKGNAKKIEVQKYINDKYKNLNFKNYDESDSYAVGLAFFIERGILK